MYGTDTSLDFDETPFYQDALGSWRFQQPCSSLLSFIEYDT